MSKMPLSLRSVLVSGAIAVLCALTVALAVTAVNRPTILIGSPAASTGDPATAAGVVTSGDATVSRKPDLAILYVGVESKESTASAAQQDLAGKAAKLIARAKALGIPDKEINTSNYSVSPNYTPNTGTVDGYRASETLVLKWHNVDTTGKALDGLVQQGGATQISVSFGLADPKAAQAEARKLAIADARSRAQAMASAAGVQLGKVLRVSDLTVSGYPSAGYSIKAADAAVPTQVPVGQLDVQITVEVDFAIA
jgi:uncharacterized protein YggE